MLVGPRHFGRFPPLVGLLLGSAHAQDAPTHVDSPAVHPSSPHSEAETERTLRARRHFQNGIKLYKDANYPGALAEFEAAYAEKPAPGSLQNMALAMKALFRYAEAAETLRLLLERHGQELSDDERLAVNNAKDELVGLVGTLLVTLSPAHALLTVNGRSVSSKERTQGLLLNVGEHTLIAEAPGFTRRTQVVRMASQQRLTLPLTLLPTSGFLEVIASDRKAAIAINGEPLAFGRWSGPVAPGIEHTIQVYRSGFEPFETTVRAELGETLRIEGVLGAETGEAVDSTLPLPSTPEKPPSPRGKKGGYALVTLSVVGLNDAPLGLEIPGSSAKLSLPSFGARGGYRLSEPLAIEASLEVGRLDAKGACQRVDDGGCETRRDFSLSSLRLGPTLRLFTRGDTLRFTTGIGAGVVSHRLELAATESPALDGGSASGIDPYFSLDLGLSYNYRHLLLELGVIAYIEGVTGLRGAFDERDSVAVFESGALPLLGLGLKVGYSAWTSRR